MLLTSFNDVFSQSKISSPYSRYGLGEISFNKYTRNTSIGSIGGGFRNSRYVNHFNPASYTSSDSMWVVFENTINSNYEKLSNWKKEEYSNNIALSSLLIQYPITKWWAGSFGLLPYSKVGYNISETNSINDSTSFNNLYTGNGGLNTFYLGNAFKIKKCLSIGFNASILFGNINRSTDISSSLSDENYGAHYDIDYTISSIFFKYGLQYENKLNNNYKYSLGVSFTNSDEIKYKRSFIAYTYNSLSNKDTIDDYSNSNLKIKLPLHVIFGAVLTKNDKWFAGVDYQYLGFSDYEFIADETSNYKNNNIIAFGAQTLPNLNANKYINKISYGIGFRYSDGYLKFKNTNITEYAFTFGLGLPIKRSNSIINLGFELGQRGTEKNALLKEKFVALNITFAFAERWFYKKKFD